MTDASTPVPRVGGRVLLLDPDERLLLIHERIEDGSTHWLTPGGGLEGTESAAEAAVRETWEELGLRVTLFPPDEVATTRRRWSWAGTVYDQVDHFFVARVGSGVQLEPAALTPMEQSTVLGHAWWTIAELGDTDEVLVPAELGQIVQRVVGGVVERVVGGAGVGNTGVPDSGPGT